MANRDRFVDSGSNPSTGGTVGRIRQHAAHGALCRHGNGCGMGYRRLPSFVPFFSFWHICKFLVAVGVVVARNDPVGMVELARAHDAVVGLGTSGYWGLCSRGHDRRHCPEHLGRSHSGRVAETRASVVGCPRGSGDNPCGDPMGPAAHRVASTPITHIY